MAVTLMFHLTTTGTPSSSIYISEPALADLMIESGFDPQFMTPNKEAYVRTWLSQQTFETAIKAIKAALGDHARKIVVNSTKSMTGHLLGGAGGIESIFTVLALHHQISPPTINIFNQDPECDLDYCANQAREMKIDVALKNNFGFGGTNGSLVFKRV